MAVLVVDGAIVACTFGAAPSALAALPANPTRGSNSAAATIMDFAPMVNIQPFGICSSPANPQVIAATSAAAGVFTPQPCIPATASPWVPGSPAVTIGGQPQTLKGQTYLYHFAMLQVQFHATTAYDLIRHVGVPVGKRDYLGPRPTN